MNRAKNFIAFTLLLVFAVCVSAQKTKTTKTLDNLDLIKMNNQSENLEPGFVTPNELAGYEFFKKGKTSKIRLGVSTKMDVESLFGSDCRKPCDYDPNWSIAFDYFEKDLVVIEGLNTSVEKQYVPKKESVGKISSVSFRPKKKTSFENTTFSNEFKKHSYLETGYPAPTDKNGVLVDVYTDSYSLQYLIFDKFTSDTFKDTFNLRKQFSNFRKGDLIIVKYTIPEELQNRFLVEDR